VQPGLFKQELGNPDTVVHRDGSSVAVGPDAAIRLAAVDFDTPQILAAARTEPPGTTALTACNRGRPSRFPCALARARPATTRSRMRSRSNSARAARMWSWSFP